MIYLRTGVPGAGKTLNSLKEICADPATTRKTKYYNNIKAFLLDIDFCNTFQGYFYGVHWPSVQGSKQENRYRRVIKKVHSEQRLVELEDVPWLAPAYSAYDEAAAISLFVSWCRKCYPKSNLTALNEYLSNIDRPDVNSIKLLNYHWTHFPNPCDWPSLPNGSVALFDECQDYFPPLANSAKRPYHYTQFQKHRHGGFDIHLVTQHFTFLDNVIQKCTNHHIHYFVPLGGKAITRFERDKQFNPDYRGDTDNCVKKMIMRDSGFYGVYWSADEHTRKLKIPPKLLMFLLLPFFLAFLVYKLLGITEPQSQKDANKDAELTQEPNTSNKPQSPVTNSIVFKTNSKAHPLTEICESYAYGGNTVKRRGNLIEIEHYITCETGEVVERRVSSPSGDEQQLSREEVIKDREQLLLTSEYLQSIGYRITLIDRLPVLTFDDQKIYLNQF